MRAVVLLAIPIAIACGGASDDAPDASLGGSVDAGRCGAEPESPYCITRPPNDPVFVDRSADVPIVVASDNDSGGGTAFVDYDADGDLDVLIVNGNAGLHGLFRNDGGAFTNVTEAAGITATDGGTGVAAADIDNDGFVDLYISGGGGLLTVRQSPTHLYRNRGDGTFEDISATAGAPGAETAASAAFGDFDGDGFVDLYVTGIGSFAMVPGQHTSRLYRNQGDLTFTDVTDASGVLSNRGACAAAFSDWDGDGHLDLFVANCNDIRFRLTPFELWHNQGDGTFVDRAAEAGLDRDGFWMGIDIADLDNDGDLDLFASNLGTIGEGLDAVQSLSDRFREGTLHALYLNDGTGHYTDVADAAGVARRKFAFGTGLADFDNDGNADIAFVGAWSLPAFGIRWFGPGLGNHLTMLMGNGDGTWAPIAPALPVNLEDHYTLGLATGDFDGNGFDDVAVGSISAPGLLYDGQLWLLENQGNGNAWITLALEGTTSNRMGIGAAVTVRSGDLVQIREVRAGSSYLSCHSPWLTFGLGARESVDEVEVRWPSGLVERFTDLAPRARHNLVEGTGTLVP